MMQPRPSARPTASRFSRPQLVLLFLSLVVLAAIPIVTHPVPPLSDYPNHLARMHVIAVLDRDPDLSRYYELDWHIIPNLMMDLVVPWFDRVVDIYTAGQMFTILTFVLIMSGTTVLNRVLFGGWSAWPFIAFPLLYSGVFLLGLMNYLFGIGLALWGLAAWVHWRERWLPVRLVLATAVVALLYVCHLFAVGLYAIGLLGFEIWRLTTLKGPLWPRLLDFVLSGLPFLVVPVLLVGSPTWGLASQNEWEPRGKIDGLITVIEVYSDVVAFGIAATIAITAGWAARHGLLKLHPAAWIVFLVGTVVYLALPRVLFGSYFADQRLPIALAFMAVAFADLDLHRRWTVRAFCIVLVALIVVRVFEVQLTWRQLTKWTASMEESIAHIDRGAKVLVAYDDDAHADDVRDLGLAHAACLAMIEKSALVTTAFAVRGKQILQLKPAWRDHADIEDGTPPSASQLIAASMRSVDTVERFWDDWPSRFDYVYLLYTERGDENPAPAWMTLVYEGARFQLYRVIPTPPG
jgi:hypothetical protein